MRQLTGKAVRAAKGHRAVAVAQCVAPIRDVGIGVACTEHNRAASVVHEALVAPIGAPNGGEPRSRLSKADDEEETKQEHFSAPTLSRDCCRCMLQARRRAVLHFR